MTPKQWKRLFARIALWAGFSIGSILLVLLGIATWNLYTKERAVSQEHYDEAHALSELQGRKTALESDLKVLGTERGIEEEVRKRFPVAKPGEEEILLVASKQSAATTTPKKGFWDGLLGWWPW